MHNITIGYTLAIGVAVGIVLVVGNVRPGWQLACRDKLVRDVAGEGFDHRDGNERALNCDDDDIIRFLCCR